MRSSQVPSPPPELLRGLPFFPPSRVAAAEAGTSILPVSPTQDTHSATSAAGAVEAHAHATLGDTVAKRNGRDSAFDPLRVAWRGV